MPVARHELQRADRHLLFLHRFPGAGGATDVHTDGWGIAFFEERAPALPRPQPSSASPIAELVRHYPIRSKNVVAHIRKATQGAIGLENTHPFMRELWGRYWIFAHNGNLVDFSPPFDGSFPPVGCTDSERAFAGCCRNSAAGSGPRRRETKHCFRPSMRSPWRSPATASSTSSCPTASGCSPTPRPGWPTSSARRPSPRPTCDQDVTVDFNQVTAGGPGGGDRHHSASPTTNQWDADAGRQPVVVCRRGCGAQPGNRTGPEKKPAG